MNPRLLLAALLLFAVGGTWYAYEILAEDLPPARSVELQLERKDARLNTPDDDRVYGNQAPYDCRRDDGDASTDEKLDDIDFICTPRKNTGEACDPGECAGLVVDVEDGRVSEYEQFGGG